MSRTNKRVFLYCRVAHPDSVSLEMQRQRLMDFAKEQGYSIAGMSVEEASGLRIDRPGLELLYSAIAGGQIDAVLVDSYTRICRDLMQFNDFYEMLERKSIKLISLKEPQYRPLRVAYYMRVGNASQAISADSTI